LYLALMIFAQQTLNVRGRLLDLSAPCVMGILNVTPDSFFDGGAYGSVEAAVTQATGMLEAGAQIIDIGGMSSRPGASIIPSEEEQRRVLPVVEAVHSKHPGAVLSIDTVWAETADRALEAGASIVNDISGGTFDTDITAVSALHSAPFILMHMQGTPGNMQKDPVYDDVAEEVLRFFIKQVRVLREAGVKDIVVDPGFGFGKTVEHNYTLLNKLGVFAILELPILVGISRKSMICKVLGVHPKSALNGTTALHMVALLNGATILRAHDVREVMEVIKLYQELQSVTTP
jgi:dihydropteroate synthase